MPERLIRPGILTSDPVNTLSWGAEVFYRRLMSVVDDYGRYDGRLAVLRASLYALKIAEVSERNLSLWITECVTARLVTVYEVDERKFVQIEKFDQRIQGKPKWPAPKKPESPLNPPESTVNHGEPPGNTALFGVGDECGDVGAEATDEPSPTSKGEEKKSPELTDEAYIAELSSDRAYTGLNIAQEAAKMACWCKANGKQPTRRRFINWLNRADRPMEINGANGHQKPKRSI